MPAESRPPDEDSLTRAVEELELLVWRLRDRIQSYDLVRRSHQRVIQALSRSLAEMQKPGALERANAEGVVMDAQASYSNTESVLLNTGRELARQALISASNSGVLAEASLKIALEVVRAACDRINRLQTQEEIRGILEAPRSQAAAQLRT